MRTGNVFEKIKSHCSPDAFDLRTAEGRSDWDDALRERLLALAGEDRILRSHAAEMVKHWRRDVFAAINREIFESVEYEIFSFGDQESD
jgi:hypothetical protein